ncbi:MAG: hypothetical protein EOM08_00675 [Clostridia bacterium]|nr:hypothetical protein [Clostridia bacterium]NCC74929.1 hypothetical protein [Clostridia bacterium]
MKSLETKPEHPVRPVEPQGLDRILALKQLVQDQVRQGMAYLKKHGPYWLRQIKLDVQRDSKQAVRAIRRVGQERVYRLKGYTTVAKINRKRQSERQQRFLRRILLILFAVLLAILLMNVYNPIQDLSEWYRIIGIKHLGEAINLGTSAVP